METVDYRPADLTPEGLRAFFAEVLADLDARPRRLRVRIFATAALEIGFEDGNPVFRVAGRRAARADYRRRWIPDHAVPCAFAPGRAADFVLSPTDGNRLRVRRRTVI